jgi:hypothetical protein
MKFKNFIYRTLSVVGLACLSAVASYGQVTTNGGSGLAATYPDLEAAITALNGATITAPVVITLTAANPQTAPAGGYVITAEGTAANTITISGSNNIVTASAGHTVGNINDAIFKLVGADYVTLQGFTMQENAANTVLATAATNNMTEWGVALLYASTTNGAQNNTIQNNTISLNRAYFNSFGIYSNSTHSATNATTSATATSNNTGLKIYGNAISNVNLGIAVVGPTAAANFQTVDIGGTTPAQGNTITDYATSTQLSSYANLSGTGYGILLRNVTDYNVSNNTIASSNGGYTVTSTMRGIFVTAGSTTPTGTFVQTINNNSISLRPGASTTITGIEVTGTTSTATSSLSINSNDFNNFGHTVAATSSVTFISNVMAVLTTNINSNTFTNLSLGTTGGVTFIFNSVTRPANAICNANGNSIVTGFNKTGAGGTVLFYTSNSFSPATATEINTNNNFSNITVTGATTITGWRNTDGGSPTKTVSNNTFSNIVGGTSSITGLAVSFSGSGVVINNTVSNISSEGSITGIESTGGSQNIDNNNVFNLTTTGSSTVTGMLIGGGTTQNVRKNKVTNLESSGATGAVNGILVTGGTLVELSNNIVGDLRVTAASAANPLNGINITGSTTINVFHNTVYLAGTSSGVNFGSSAISASSTPALTLSNNIFVNASTANGTGLAVAYRRSSTTLTSYQTSSNRNAFFASTIYTDGTNTDATFGAFQARMATRDGLSINENPPFVSLVSSNANYLHINTTIATGVESGGMAIAGITNDFSGDIRFGNAGYSGTGFAPDMGADEFNGITNIAACAGAPAASNAVSSVTSTCPSVAFNLSLSTAYTATGITYQWQSSADGVTYSNIVGATTATTTASQTAATFYRAIVSCSNSGQSITATPVSVVQSTRFFCYCAPTYTSGGGGGDGIANVSLNTLNNTSGAAPSPYYTFFNTVTIPSITQNATETISITFGTFGNTHGGVWIDYNQDGDFNDAGEFVANTTVASTPSGTSVLTFVVPLGALTGQTLMRVRSAFSSQLTNTPCGAASSAFGETEDYIVNIVATTACAGAPAASNAVSSVTTTCPSVAFNLSLSTSYSATGISYQWQSSADGVTYSNIAGATTATTTASQTAATFYRAIVTCANSGSSITATPVSVAQNSLFTCYCASTYTSGAGTTDGITNVRLNTLNNTSTQNNVSPYYTFFNTVTIPSITQNTTETISVTFGSDGSQFTGVWIDYNQDGDFNDAGEFVANNTVTAGSNGTAVLSFTVPLAALTGQTLMRVRGGNDSQLGNTPCGAASSGFGETEDYIVNIVATMACSGAPAAANSVASVTSTCPSVAFNLSLSTSYSATGITYQWQSSADGVTYSNIVGATTATTTASQTAATFYRAIVTCANSGQSVTATPVSVVQSTRFFCYCSTTYTNGVGSGDAVTNVRLNTLNNTSTGAAAPYYTFFNTVTIPSITQNATETISVSFGSNGSQFTGVWIDYNQDGDFNDAGEFVANNTVTAGANGTAVLTFVVPAGASLGQTLMRVRGGEDVVLTNTPCGASSNTWGETEDYIVNIVTAPACAVTATISSQTDVACFGGASGSATATANGGTAPYSFVWSNGRTTATNTGLTAGTYTVTATDVAACTATSTVTITQPASALIVTATATANVACFGGATGAATVTTNGGNPPFTFVWSDGATTATRTGLVAGTYSVTITDSNGCTAFSSASSSATITQPASALTANISTTTNVACFGGATGAATVAANGGTAPYSFAWTGGATTATNTGLSAGTYNVTVTDNSGCMTMSSATITQPASALAANASTTTNVACFGDSNGEAMVMATGGTAPYSFAWINGITTANNTGLAAGTYSVTATDANNCMSMATITITAPTSALSLNIAVDNNVSCNGLADGAITANASGGTTPYSFAWSNSQTNAIATGLAAGTYTATVTDANNCIVVGAATTITMPSALSISIASTDPTSCGVANGTATATVSGGTTAYSFNWNNGSTTAALNGLSAGSYMVTATDANGCMVMAAATLTAPNGITVSFPAFSNVSCFGADDATINADVVGGTAPFSFVWNNNSTTQNQSGLAAGTYFVTATDANGCSNSGSLAVGAPAQLTVTTINSIDASCLTCADGTTTASSTGGTGSVSFLWSNGATTATIFGLLPNTYTVTVTDANGCSTTTNVVISGFVAVTEQTANAIRLFPNPTSSFVTIDGLNAGARLSVVNALGQVIRTVETQNNVEQIDLSDLAPAVYLIRIESGRQQTTLRVTVAK